MAPGSDITGQVRPDITRGNETSCSPDARVSQVMDMVKHHFMESVRDKGAEVASGNVSLKGSTSTEDVLVDYTERRRGEELLSLRAGGLLLY